ncbi:hypothetical protein SALBM311S_02593 [Streptomyces alboniger]
MNGLFKAEVQKDSSYSARRSHIRHAESQRQAVLLSPRTVTPTAEP